MVQHCALIGGFSSWQALSLCELVPLKNSLNGHSVDGWPLEREGGNLLHCTALGFEFKTLRRRYFVMPLFHILNGTHKWH